MEPGKLYIEFMKLCSISLIFHDSYTKFNKNHGLNKDRYGLYKDRKHTCGIILTLLQNRSFSATLNRDGEPFLQGTLIDHLQIEQFGCEFKATSNTAKDRRITSPVITSHATSTGFLYNEYLGGVFLVCYTLLVASPPRK